jgi:hypothetical protein
VIDFNVSHGANVRCFLNKTNSPTSPSITTPDGIEEETDVEDATTTPMGENFCEPRTIPSATPCPENEDPTGSVLSSIVLECTRGGTCEFTCNPGFEPSTDSNTCEPIGGGYPNACNPNKTCTDTINVGTLDVARCLVGQSTTNNTPDNACYFQRGNNYGYDA